MPRKAQVKVQSATSTNTKLALATAALLIASGLAFIATPSVRGPGAQTKCGLNSFDFRDSGTAHGTCYSGKKVTAYIRGAEPQTLSTNLTAQCLAECLNCPAGYEAVAGKDSDCLISCVKAKPQPKKKAVKKSGRKSSRKSDPVMMAQDNVGSCTDRDGNPLPAPNDGVGVCREHDGSPDNYVWTGPGPEAESEYCASNELDNAPCSYRCASGKRVNPSTQVCELFCQNSLVPNADNSACECGSGLYYSTQHNHCMSRESCVGGDDLIVNDSTGECHTCGEGTVPNNYHTACVCPAGECEDENGICGTENCDPEVGEEPIPSAAQQAVTGSCLDQDGVASEYPASRNYSGDIRSCQNGGIPEPGQTNEWVYDANCSRNQACTFQCGENRVPNGENYCEPCASGFTPNEDNTACTCQDSPGRRVVFHGENTYGITVCETCPSNSLSITYADGSIGCVTQNRCTAIWEEGGESRYNFGGTVNELTCECANGPPTRIGEGCPAPNQINISMGQRQSSNVHIGSAQLLELSMLAQEEVEVLSLDFRISTSNLSIEQIVNLRVGENMGFFTPLNEMQQGDVYNATFSVEDGPVIIGGGQPPTNVEVYANISDANNTSAVITCLVSVRHRSGGVESTTELGRDYCWSLDG